MITFICSLLFVLKKQGALRNSNPDMIICSIFLN